MSRGHQSPGFAIMYDIQPIAGLLAENNVWHLMSYNSVKNKVITNQYLIAYCSCGLVTLPYHPLNGLAI